MKTAKWTCLGQENKCHSLDSLTVTELNNELNADYSPPRTRLIFGYSRYKAHASLMTNLEKHLVCEDATYKLVWHATAKTIADAATAKTIALRPYGLLSCHRP